MYDINSVLKLFADEFAMNYCIDFDVIKSILEYCDCHVKQLEKVQFRGGNVHVITEIATRLKNFFNEAHYFADEHPADTAHTALRKITMFLALNTDVTFKYNLRNDRDLVHVLDECPQLSKFLLASVIWETRLDKYFYELLAYTPCWFSFQYFQPAVASLKYIDEPYEVLEKVESLIKAIMTSVCRADERVIDVVDQTIILGKLYDHSMDLLRQFYTPDAEKFKAFSKSDFFKYSGYAVKHLLQMLLFCFDCVEGKLSFRLGDELKIYNIFTELCPERDGSDRKKSTLIKEHQMKIVAAVLNSLQYNVCLISIDVFMYWVEVDLSDEETLQARIGGLAYNALQRMKDNREFGHDIEPQLTSIAIRPKTFDEILKEASMRDILLKLDEERTKDTALWLGELFNRPIAFENDECLETIANHLKLVTPEHCESVLDYVQLKLKSDDEDEQHFNENLFPLLLQAIDNFSSDQITFLLSLCIKYFGRNAELFQSEDFPVKCTTFFNKSTSAFDLQAFLCLCFENPHATWTKFFDEAFSSEQNIRNFCAALKSTEKFSWTYFEEMLDTLFASDKTEERLLPQFLAQIYFDLYQQRKAEFFKHFVNKNVNALLERDDFERLLPMVKALNLIAAAKSSSLSFGEVTAPVLLMAAQIMEKARWDLVSYTDVRDEIVRGSVEFIQTVSKKFLPVATEKDKKWINKVIMDSYRPTTQYYFHKYSLALGEPTKTFDKFLIPMEFEDKSEAEMFLIINYVRCTTKETEWLAKSDRLLPHISDMIIMLAGVVREAGHPNAINNYRHCMMNYANIVDKFLLAKVAASPEQVQPFGLKLLKVIHSSPAEIYEEMFISFESVLMKVFALLPAGDEANEFCAKEVRKVCATMKKCKGRDVFLEKFEALVAGSL